MERKNEKEINCNQAQELFYGFAACELSSEDMRLLSRHEASCPACGPEFQEWRRLRQALQSSGIAPTTDFKAGVMERIRSTRKAPAAQQSRSGAAIWQHGWARGVAAAAVVLIMLTGVAKLPAVESLIAHYWQAGHSRPRAEPDRRAGTGPTHRPRQPCPETT